MKAKGASKGKTKKLAIVIGASDYSTLSKSSDFYDQPQSSADALEMEMFLKAHHYKVQYCNLTPSDKFNYGGRVYAGTVLEKLESIM